MATTSSFEPAERTSAPPILQVATPDRFDQGAVRIGVGRLAVAGLEVA
jgi:hypothetical protein